MPLTACRLSLIGLMGAGKSRAGRLVAAALSWPFHDADLLVERDSGLSIPRLFATEGEAGFRAREARVLADLAASPPPFVVATGGGVVTSEGNILRLREAFTVIWLRITPEEAARRLAGGKGRPLLTGGDPLKVLRELAALRDPLYAQASHRVIDCHRETAPEDLRDEIIEILSTLPSRRGPAAG
jgi:shikimate kinase